MPDLTQFVWIAWLLVILVCVIIELLTLEFTFLMIAAGSLGGLATNLLGGPWWLQIIVAAALSVLLLLTIRPLLLRVMHRGADPTPSNLDALKDMSGRVVLAVGETGGQVRLANGETWTAGLGRAAVGPLAVGSTVAVERIEGATAYVYPTSVPAPPLEAQTPTEGRAES
ncbi:NfeD family protein [Amnibacterium flavum]|nr:NfeD family protein [Amnibacterium flavum]